MINSQGIMQSPVVREHAGIADDQVIMISIAMGWPDDTFPANAVVSRAQVGRGRDGVRRVREVSGRTRNADTTLTCVPHVFMFCT